jgi:hypothetical protein
MTRHWRRVDRAAIDTIGRWARRAIPLLALACPWAGSASAQDAAASPLPAIVYPQRQLDPMPAGVAPSPPPVGIGEDGVPVRYYLVGGVWGFWGRDGHFHPRPATIVNGPMGVNGPTGPRSNTMATRPGNGVRPAGFPPIQNPGALAPRHTVGLSNQPPRAIVVQSPIGRDRGPMR